MLIDNTCESILYCQVKFNTETGASCVDRGDVGDRYLFEQMAEYDDCKLCN